MTTRKRPDSAASSEQPSPSLPQIVDDSSRSDTRPPPAKRSNHNEETSRNVSVRSGSTPPAHHTLTSSIAMANSLRALYFAPIALLVLDHNRHFIMLNEPAKVVLGLTNSACTDQQWDHYLPPSSIQTLILALEEARQQLTDNSIKVFSTTTPVKSQLEIIPVQGQSGTSTIIDLSISAWCQESGSTTQSAQNTFFTISLVPSSSSSSNNNNNNNYNSPLAANSDENTTIPIESKKEYDLVKEFALQELDLPFMALSTQGNIVDRNRASDEIWSSLRDTEPNPESDANLGKNDEFDLSWAAEMANVTDENFEKDFPLADWPIYKCAILGERVDPIRLGVESKLTGKRMVVEYVGYPIRTNRGRGEHIGAIMTFRNVTAERERLIKEAEHQGDVYFKKTCNAMPQLVFVTDDVGQSEWYSDSWYEYTGAPQNIADTKAWADYWHPDDLENAMQDWLEAVRLQKLWSTTFRVRRYDGVFRWFQGRALPIKESSTGKIIKWYGTLTDINDQQESLSASRRAQKQLESVINHADVTLWATNREGIITIAKGPGVKQLRLATSSTTSSGSEKESNNDGQQQQGNPDVEKRPDPPIRSGSSSNNNNNNNNAAQSTTSKVLVGRSIHDVWDSTNIRKAMSQALNGETLVEEMEIDGRWYRTSYSPLRAQSDEMMLTLVGEQRSEHFDDETMMGEGEIVGVVGASMDITERKAAQAQMEKSLVDKTTALAAEGAAKEASRLKSEFLANMSHEIRTPIAGVIGLSELMLDEDGMPLQLREYAETIRRSAEGLLNVINDVLDFSKVEIGKLHVEMAPFHLATLLMDAKRMLSFATEKKNLDFKESLELNYHGLLIGDFGRLKQVIINLLTNAIKFTSKGYISLEVTEMLEDDEKIQVCFDIRDTGCGISEDALSRLFQPFSQADPSTARRFGGTGLGLSISKNLVELMEGEIGLESIEGQGSHAWFRIPFYKAKAGETVEDDRRRSSDSLRMEKLKDDLVEKVLADDDDDKSRILEQPRENIWILIAEDNEVNARIALKNVEKLGFQCRIAKNGLVALQELASRRYDLVLMDCQMPECDGYEATRLIRSSADATIRALPVIALTASAIKGDRERALDAGMVDYLIKPVLRSALETSLCKWLFDQRARQVLSKYNTKSAPNLSPKSGGGKLTSISAMGSKKAAVIRWSETVQEEGARQGIPIETIPSSAAKNREGWKEANRFDPFGSNMGDAASLFTTGRANSLDQTSKQSSAIDEKGRPLFSSRSRSYGAYHPAKKEQ